LIYEKCISCLPSLRTSRNSTEFEKLHPVRNYKHVFFLIIFGQVRIEAVPEMPLKFSESRYLRERNADQQVL